MLKCKIEKKSLLQIKKLKHKNKTHNHVYIYIDNCLASFYTIYTMTLWNLIKKNNFLKCKTRLVRFLNINYYARERAGELFVKMKPCKEEMIRERERKKSFGRFWFGINYFNNFTKKKYFDYKLAFYLIALVFIFFSQLKDFIFNQKINHSFFFLKLNFFKISALKRVSIFFP